MWNETINRLPIKFFLRILSRWFSYKALAQSNFVCNQMGVRLNSGVKTVSKFSRNSGTRICPNCLSQSRFDCIESSCRSYMYKNYQVTAWTKIWAPGEKAVLTLRSQEQAMYLWDWKECSQDPCLLTLI